VSFATITLCVACKRIFRYDSVRKLLDTPSYSVLAVFFFSSGYKSCRMLGFGFICVEFSDSSQRFVLQPLKY
jgi:hypothetical protein